MRTSEELYADGPIAYQFIRLAVVAAMVLIVFLAGVVFGIRPPLYFSLSLVSFTVIDLIRIRRRAEKGKKQ